MRFLMIRYENRIYANPVKVVRRKGVVKTAVGGMKKIKHFAVRT